MKPAAFDYCAAEHVDEVLELRNQYGDDALILAGGLSLMPMLNMRLAQPTVVIDIARLRNESPIHLDSEFLTVNACTTQSQLMTHRLAMRAVPILSLALPYIGHYQTRARGTICGSICHADPSAELPLCLALLGGEVEMLSKNGSRRLTAEHFQQGVFTTAITPNEILNAVHFPRATEDDRFSFVEFSIRHGDFAVVAVAIHANSDSIRIGISGVEDRPIVKTFAATRATDFDDVVADVSSGLNAVDDLHASGDFRRHLVSQLTHKALEQVM